MCIEERIFYKRCSHSRIEIIPCRRSLTRILRFLTLDIRRPNHRIRVEHWTYNTLCRSCFENLFKKRARLPKEGKKSNLASEDSQRADKNSQDRHDAPPRWNPHALHHQHLPSMGASEQSRRATPQASIRGSNEHSGAGGRIGTQGDAERHSEEYRGVIGLHPALIGHRLSRSFVATCSFPCLGDQNSCQGLQNQLKPFDPNRFGRDSERAWDCEGWLDSMTEEELIPQPLKLSRHKVEHLTQGMS